MWRRAIEAIESEYAATIEIQDRDEFDVACQMGWMTPDDAEIASTTASALEHVLRQRTSPLGDEGWHKQDALKKQGEAVF